MLHVECVDVEQAFCCVRLASRSPAQALSLNSRAPFVPLIVGYLYCRIGVSFASSNQFLISDGLNVTITCKEPLVLSLHSKSGGPMVDAGAKLTIKDCDVVTVASRDVAASAPAPPEWSSDYFGKSSGTIRLEDSRMMMPAEVRFCVCKIYLA
jgi:hypothetical protein